MVPIRPNLRYYPAEEQILHRDLSRTAKSELRKKREGGGRGDYIGRGG
jgi:hypothetical protein